MSKETTANRDDADILNEFLTIVCDLMGGEEVADATQALAEWANDSEPAKKTLADALLTYISEDHGCTFEEYEAYPRDVNKVEYEENGFGGTFHFPSATQCDWTVLTALNAMLVMVRAQNELNKADDAGVDSTKLARELLATWRDRAVFR